MVNFLRLRQYNFGKTFTCTCRRLELPTSQPTWFPTKRASSHKVRAKGCSPFTNHGSESQKTGTQLQRGPISRDMRKSRPGVGALPVAQKPKGGLVLGTLEPTHVRRPLGLPPRYTAARYTVYCYVATCTVWMSAATIIAGGTDWACSRLRAFFFQ